MTKENLGMAVGGRYSDMLYQFDFMNFYALIRVLAFASFTIIPFA